MSHATGDTQLAVFDLENKLAFVSYSSADAKTKAYLRSPIKVDLAEFFKPFWLDTRYHFICRYIDHAGGSTSSSYKS